MNTPLAKALAAVTVAATTLVLAATVTTTSAHAVTPAPTMKAYVGGNGSRGLGAVWALTSPTTTGVGSVVVCANWSDLETSQGVYNTTSIDKALSSAAAKGLRVRLRVIAGTQAPAYVKKIGGTPVPFYDHQARAATTIGRFWTTAYQARWQALMTYLARKYDNDQRVRAVNIAGTGTISAEVMLTMGNDTIPGSTMTNNSRLLAAGATETARRAALMNDITFMQRTWAHTHTTLFSHPYVPISPSPRASLTATEQIVTAAYNSKPGATVFGHTGASQSTFDGTSHANVLAMYKFFVAKHYPFMAQTQTYSGGAKNAGVGNLAYVLTWLAAHGAYSTELPSGWQTDAAALRVLPYTSRRMTASATAGSALMP